MRFLEKKKNSEILKKKLKYSEYNDRKTLRNILLKEQYGFCAFTEKYIASNYEYVSIDHFYPKNQFPEKIDDYYNLFSVGIINQNRPKKITEPILEPSSNKLNNRISYKNGYFYVENNEDAEAINFIDYLNIGEKNIDLTIARRNHVNKIRKFLVTNNINIEYLIFDKRNFDFITALINDLSDFEIEKTFMKLIRNN